MNIYYTSSLHDSTPCPGGLCRFGLESGKRSGTHDLLLHPRVTSTQLRTSEGSAMAYKWIRATAALWGKWLKRLLRETVRQVLSVLYSAGPGISQQSYCISREWQLKQSKGLSSCSKKEWATKKILGLLFGEEVAEKGNVSEVYRITKVVEKLKAELYNNFCNTRTKGYLMKPAGDWFKRGKSTSLRST